MEAADSTTVAQRGPVDGWTYPVSVFDQDMVVAADGDEEQDHLYVVEDVDPLFPLGPLATDIDHFVGKVAQLEDGLGDARGA